MDIESNELTFADEDDLVQELFNRNDNIIIIKNFHRTNNCELVNVQKKGDYLKLLGLLEYAKLKILDEYMDNTND